MYWLINVIKDKIESDISVRWHSKCTQTLGFSKVDNTLNSILKLFIYSMLYSNMYKSFDFI